LNVAALKAVGSIAAWGSYADGEGAPTDSGYTNIYSTQYALIEPSALRAAKAYLDE
jgi:hypothetical protein